MSCDIRDPWTCEWVVKLLKYYLKIGLLQLSILDQSVSSDKKFENPWFKGEQKNDFKTEFKLILIKFNKQCIYLDKKWIYIKKKKKKIYHTWKNCIGYFIHFNNKMDWPPVPPLSCHHYDKRKIRHRNLRPQRKNHILGYPTNIKLDLFE